MKWVCSDGSVVELGGKAHGGRVAERVRATVAGLAFSPVSIAVGAQPRSELLDLDNPEHVDALVRRTAASLNVAVLEAPELTLERANEAPRKDGVLY